MEPGAKESSRGDGFESWAFVEVMGHRRIGGRVSEATIAGAPLLRVDVPRAPPDEGFTTQFYGGQAIYCLTPSTEELVRAFAAQRQEAPISPYELPEAFRKRLAETYRERGEEE